MTPEQIADRDSVWERVAREHPEFTREHDAAGNYHAVREIVLGGSIPWSGFHQRFKPQPGMRIIDIGANAGIFSAFCALKGAQVTAYEPFVKVCSLLAFMICRTGLLNIKLRNAAVWKETGECRYMGFDSLVETCPAYNGSVPSEGLNWKPADFEKAVNVRCVSLDDAVGSHTWDCVKMDIEGAEFEVLLAASLETLRRIKFMYLELHPWVSEKLYKETLARLEAVFKFEGAYWNPDIGRWEAVYLSHA